MSNENHRPRRFFAADSEIGEAFVKMAARRNLTLYALLNDMLKKAVELDAAGVSLDEVFRSFRILKGSKEIGFVAVPEKLWYETAEIANKADPKGAYARFGEAGEWIGKYSLAKSEGRDLVEHLTQCLSPLTYYSSDFSSKGSDIVHLRCVNHQYSSSYAESFSNLLTRAFEKIGYPCTAKNVSKGMLLLTFRKPAQPKIGSRGEIFA